MVEKKLNYETNKYESVDIKMFGNKKRN